MLSDDKLKIIMKSYLEFIAKDAPSQSYFETVNNRYKLVKDKFLNWPVLSGMSDDDLYKYLKQYTNTLDGPKIAYGERRLRSFIPHFRKTVHYLLNSTDTIEEKLLNTVSNEGEYAFPNIKKQFWTPVFAALDLTRYPNSNNKTRDALSKLGFHVDPGVDAGQQYMQVIQAFEKLHKLMPEMDFLKIDHLWHYVVAIPEGIQLVEKLSQGDVEKSPIAELPTSIPSSIQLLLKKKQIILYGPPGTGKTYDTRNIAVSLVGLLPDSLDGDLPEPPGEGVEEPTGNALYEKIVSFIKTLPNIEIRKSSSMAGYYSHSNRLNKKLGLVWVGYVRSSSDFFKIYLRKESGGYYPVEFTRKIPGYKNSGWGGYPEFVVRTEEDANTTIELIKYASEHF